MNLFFCTAEKQIKYFWLFKTTLLERFLNHWNMSNLSTKYFTAILLTFSIWPYYNSLWSIIFFENNLKEIEFL